MSFYSSLFTFVVIVQITFFIVCTKASSQPSSFIYRDNYTLIDPANPSVPFKYLGCNIYWLGLDQNVPPNVIAYPTKFRIRDALYTAKGLGFKVVRSHTLGISTGNPLSFEPTYNIFNHEALDAADYAIYVAGELGLRLVIPFTDNYYYYHGGLHNFCQFMNISNEKSICYPQFYSNASVVAAFQNFIKHRLLHVNPYTGRPAYQETAILAWETGNEIDPPPIWTKNIASYIKSIDKNHLVLSGRNGVSLEELAYPEVDIYSSHFYPPIDVRLALDVDLTKAANKVYLAGEFGWTYNGTGQTVAPFLDIIQKSPSAFSALFWSLFPHDDDPKHDYGYVNHNDGFTMHYYPCDDGFMKSRLETIQNYAWQIATGNASNKCSDSANWFNVTSAPVLQRSAPSAKDEKNHPCFSWRGATGATEYNIYRNCSTSKVSAGWKLVASNKTDFDPIWCDDESENVQDCYYQVEPISAVCGFVPGPKSNAVEVKNSF